MLDEAAGYALRSAGYSGNAGRDALRLQSGMKFTTFDRDNDDRPSDNCAALTRSGFWFKSCSAANVNGVSRDFSWDRLPGGSSLRAARMWLQCR